MRLLGNQTEAQSKGWFLLVAWAAVSLLVSIILPAEPARSETRLASTDVELRGGTDYLCGTCGPYRLRPMMQLFADIAVPIIPLGNEMVGIGPYVKGALLDGHIPQIAGGMLLSYRIGNYEWLGHIGRAYATERVGQTAVPDSGQTKGTYDLGLLVRYAISQRFFLSAGYQHNSNGEGLGLKFNHETGTNRGIDSLFLGIGIRL